MSRKTRRRDVPLLHFFTVLVQRYPISHCLSIIPMFCSLLGEGATVAQRAQRAGHLAGSGTASGLLHTSHAAFTIWHYDRSQLRVVHLFWVNLYDFFLKIKMSKILQFVVLFFHLLFQCVILMKICEWNIKITSTVALPGQVKQKSTISRGDSFSSTTSSQLVYLR